MHRRYRNRLLGLSFRALPVLAGSLIYALGTERAMSRVKLSRATFLRARLVMTTVIAGLALAGCSAMPDWAPDWLSSKPSSQSQPLQFVSDPPGADVRTGQGQTCLTPCAIPVPSEPQTVTITKIGFVPQTVQVSVGEAPEHSFWEAAPPPTLVPNPVQVTLQPIAPPKPVRKPRPRRTVARRPPPPPGGTAPPPPGVAPPPGPPGGDPAFPPPPPSQR